jgi:PRTRC genetic system ThiF family protein
MPHYTPSILLTRRVSIALAGCGGNGSQMLTGLARLNHALTALGHPGLKVRAFDPDTVSDANMGRQLFGQFDVGSSKAIVLVQRLNAFFGLDWTAHFGRYDRNDSTRPDILIVCVDSAKARHQINRLSWRPQYIMDMGNRAADGQVIFGQPNDPPREARPLRPGHVQLPNAYDLLPELVDATAPEDDTPSCGLAEALERQELFVNQSVVTPALQILWDFFRRGELTWHGAFVNLRTGTMRPLQVKEPAEAPAPTAAEQ